MIKFRGKEYDYILIEFNKKVYGSDHTVYQGDSDREVEYDGRSLVISNAEKVTVYNMNMIDRFVVGNADKLLI